MIPDSQNPFASPQVASIAPTPAASEVEQLRLAYLEHEASIRGIGTLFLFGTAITGFYAVALLLLLVTSVVVRGLPMGLMETLLIGGVDGLLFGLTVGTYFVGRGLRRVRPQVRTAAGVFCALGLLGFPVGTLINGYFLYLLFGKKGRVVFSPEYQAAIVQTPYLRYRTSYTAWAVLILLFGLVAFGLVSLLFMA